MVQVADSPPAWLFQLGTILFWALGIAPWAYALFAWLRGRARRKKSRAWLKSASTGEISSAVISKMLRDVEDK